MLHLRLLGDIEVTRDGVPRRLPPSKKTRALLAYLALTGRPHRRERLCTLFWDIADDPRGALRWSLSKIRPLVNEPERERIVADRESVSFDASDVHIDLAEIRRSLARGAEALETEDLEVAAAAYHGEFLEGLNLPDYHDYQAWCVAEREEARALRAGILAALVGRLAEAEQQYQAGIRLAADVGVGATFELTTAWRAIGLQDPSAGAQALRLTATTPSFATTPAPEPVPADRTATELPAAPSHLVGRQGERARLLATLAEARERSQSRIAVILGEPGIGKSRLLSELTAEARRQGGVVLESRAFEAESGRPYGPWIDALRRHPTVLARPTLADDLAPLLPELAREAASEQSRDRLFGAVVEIIQACAKESPPVLLVLDDAQWCDEASAALLHYVARMTSDLPIVVALAVREGELPDNEPLMRLFRGLRHELALDEIRLGSLSCEETEQLLQSFGTDIDAERIFRESAGNPLFALEAARSLPYRQDDVSPTLADLVRDRIQRLPQEANDVLRWCALLGQSFSITRLTVLTPIDLDSLMTAFEGLERHALLHEVLKDGKPTGSYAFSHDVVRKVVSAEISEPRRRLMHLRIAKALDNLSHPDETAAADIAHHAALAGEASMAAGACVSAGQRCLRLFANAEALALARRGMHYAEQLAEPEHLKLTLELMQIRLAAQRPEAPGEIARQIEALAEQALDYG
ncbi:MAG: AAA family ATPase, partial [Alphaproteobacteria bacterium]|nr:AAA family ATPase [Alphaproteobacteria bacterium]